MPTTRSRTKPSTNGSRAADHAQATAKHAGSAVAVAARHGRGPAAAAAAGLLGGLALGARRGSKRGGLKALVTPRPRVLGIPIGRKSGALRFAETLRDGARHVGTATDRATGTAADVRALRDQLDSLNRRSPIEVLLDGLTHRRGAHRRES